MLKIKKPTNKTPPLIDLSEKVTTRTLLQMKGAGEAIVALTGYDAPMGRLLNRAGVDVILVGDSVANVKLGYANTLSVTLEEMIHHTKAVRRTNTRALLVADMPFLTYEFDPKEAVRNVGRLVKEAGAEAVKVEGAGEIIPSIRALVAANIPVMGHLGLTPQSVHRLGGYRVQGRGRAAGQALLKDALRLQAAGIFYLVLEAVPASVGRKITRALKIPTIGIGAGPGTDGQILVLDDLLGLTEGPLPRFVLPYASLGRAALDAVTRFRADVKARRFPGPGQSY
jgi:3-methyl-2-oxobutanoate hydroxymethyltransferase